MFLSYENFYLICFKCARYGHLMNNCPLNRLVQQNRAAKPGAFNEELCSLWSFNENRAGAYDPPMLVPLKSKVIKEKEARGLAENTGDDASDDANAGALSRPKTCYEEPFRPQLEGLEVPASTMKVTSRKGKGKVSSDDGRQPIVNGKSTAPPLEDILTKSSISGGGKFETREISTENKNAKKNFRRRKGKNDGKGSSLGSELTVSGPSKRPKNVETEAQLAAQKIQIGQSVLGLPGTHHTVLAQSPIPNLHVDLVESPSSEAMNSESQNSVVDCTQESTCLSSQLSPDNGASEAHMIDEALKENSGVDPLTRVI
ncbi:LOW QUALITY PROTEIN: hypothetical protein V2J09_016304 [Rumex salicifolius]